MAMQVPTEEEIIAGAIAGTEAEIFDEATGQAEDEDNGDRSLEEMDDVPGETEEGDDEPTEDEPDGEGDEEDEEVDAASEEEGEEPEPERDGIDEGRAGERGRIPSSRLREEAERRRAAESERDAFRARLAAYEAQQAISRQPQQEQPAKPDLFSDPEAWAAQQRAEIAQEFTARHVNAALADAHDEHGEEFVAAYKALTSQNPGDPTARAVVQRIWDAPNPGKAIMRWYGEQKILREVGGDPNAYKQKVVQEILSDPEFRKQILADMRGEAQRGDGGRPRTTTRLPKSLNGASGGGSRREADPELYNDSDASAFAFAMK
jgi:hypothetical protein